MERDAPGANEVKSRSNKADWVSAAEHRSNGTFAGEGVEDSAHLHGEIFDAVRFCEEAARALCEEVFHLVLGDVAAGEQDVGVRVEGLYLAEGLVSAELWHDHVEEHEVDLSWVCLVYLEGVEAVLGEDDGVS